MMDMVENGKTLPKTLLKHDTSIHFSKPYKISNNSTEVLWTELNWTLVFTKHFLFLVECSSAESIVFSRIHSCLQHKVVTNQLIETQQIVAKHSNIWVASYYGNTIITFSSSYSEYGYLWWDQWASLDVRAGNFQMFEITVICYLSAS